MLNDKIEKGDRLLFAMNQCHGELNAAILLT